MSDSLNLDPFLGKVLESRYRVDELIARGGMATVYRGTDLRLGRTVALKVLGGVLVNDPDFVERFTQEARATAALTHPNVVAVHDQGISSGFPFLVMEFVQGRTIREIMAQSGPFTSAHALEIISSVLAGLTSAHEAGFVHRDIKPENVLITDNGHIKVTDFGLARVISDTPVSDSTGAILLGTMAYLSPEQVQQLAVDQRSDVYSCGILLYEMVTGLVPFTGTSPLDVAYQHVNSNVAPPSTVQPDVPPAVDHLVLAATRKTVSERIQSANEFRDAAIRALSAVPRAEALTTALSLKTTLAIPAPASTTHQASGPTQVHQNGPNTSPIQNKGSDFQKPARRKFAPMLLLVALLIAGGAWYQFVGNSVAVPSVSALTVDQAAAIVTPLGLDFEVIKEYSEDVPIGTIIRTEPSSGQKARKGSSVNIFVSMGKERYLIPSDLAGKDPSEAISALEALTLVVSGTNEIFDETIPIGKVVGTEPIAGTSVAQRTPVTLLVSKGPTLIEVPNVVGMDVATATATLQTAGFQVTAVNKLPVAILNKVYSQNPAAGTMSPKDSVITLEIV
ncbi:MAG: Stk1 family PASTA domain-containing Ser/Thr kinase [Actinobacteria bacterium]|nr:Stk1 family PASTA domain-containing Ser/Thr kinase [Actinomycetota bacterium]